MDTVSTERGHEFATVNPGLRRLPPASLEIVFQVDEGPKVKVGNIYRLLPSGETQHLHPKDGTVPERVNAGRAADNTNARRIGDNKSPAQIKFTGKMPSWLTHQNVRVRIGVRPISALRTKNGITGTSRTVNK